MEFHSINKKQDMDWHTKKLIGKIEHKGIVHALAEDADETNMTIKITSCYGPVYTAITPKQTLLGEHILSGAPTQL